MILKLENSTHLLYNMKLQMRFSQFRILRGESDLEKSSLQVYTGILNEWQTCNNMFPEEKRNFWLFDIMQYSLKYCAI